MNNLINLARHIPSPEATLTVAYTRSVCRWATDGHLSCA
jgi:hypothetical protein